MFFLFLLRASRETVKQPPPEIPRETPKVFGPHGPREYTPETTNAPTELLHPFSSKHDAHDTVQDEEEILLTGMGAMPEVPKKYQLRFDQFEKALDEWLEAHTPPVNVIEWRSPSQPLKATDAKQMDMAGAVPFLYLKIRSLAETVSRIEEIRARGAKVPQETLNLLQHQIKVTLNSIDTVQGNLFHVSENLKHTTEAIAKRAEELLLAVSALSVSTAARKVA